jgi:hypothetical protein
VSSSLASRQIRNFVCFDESQSSQSSWSDFGLAILVFVIEMKPVTEDSFHPPMPVSQSVNRDFNHTYAGQASGRTGSNQLVARDCNLRRAWFARPWPDMHWVAARASPLL